MFRTAPPGRPGSPSHVTGTWLSGDQTALVCWEPSEVGQPFLSYTIEVLELKSNVTKIWKLSVDVVKDNLPNCTAGYSVSLYVMFMSYRLFLGNKSCACGKVISDICPGFISGFCLRGGKRQVPKF